MIGMSRRNEEEKSREFLVPQANYRFVRHRKLADEEKESFEFKRLDSGY